MGDNCWLGSQFVPVKAEHEWIKSRITILEYFFGGVLKRQRGQIRKLLKDAFFAGLNPALHHDCAAKTTRDDG